MIRWDKPTREQLGYHKQEERIKRKMGKSVEVRDHVRTLWVRGTLDVLAKSKFDRQWVKKEHPIDKGYFKKMLVLTEIGQKKLKRMLDSKQNN